tara:strand:- start:1200 stop:1982 length:783 start_codon:yes stop_codon:yes gene_type:complete
MRAIIINLDHATARMDFQRRQLSRLGIAFDRLPAVAVGDLADPADETYWAGWQRPIAVTERACLCSHIAAWKRVIDDDAPFLILEDDALLSDDVPLILSEAEKHHEWDLLQLETRKRRKLLSRGSVGLGPVRAHRLYVDRAGAAGYVLWPSGAAQLLDRAYKRPALADAMISTPGLLHALQAVPAAVIQNDIAEDVGVAPQWPVDISSVSSPNHRKVRKTPAQKCRRILAQLHLGLWDVWGGLAYQKVMAPFAADRFTDS